MVADERLVNPGDGPESSDTPRPADEDLSQAVSETDGIGNVTGMDPQMERSMTDDEGATDPSEIEDEEPKPRA
jgi:hypothetical protein